MKSKITIDLDYDNQPVIKIDYQPSDDVRDKMINRFTEAFEGSSYLCRFWFEGTGSTGFGARIRPISPKELKEHIHNIEEITKEFTKDIDSSTTIVTFKENK